MNKYRPYIFALIILTAAAAGWYLSGSDEQSLSSRLPTVGAQAPDFQLPDTNGLLRSLSSERGKVVLVNFWATWCPPCKIEMPSMEELYRNYGKGNFEILAINVDDNGQTIMPGFLNKNPHTFPILFGTQSQAATLYGVSMFPETFIVNKEGIIVQKVVGAIDWVAPKVLSELNALMKE